jgi:DedD protein
MGFFSFGKKDDAPRRRGAATKSARGSGGAFEGREPRRARRSERTGDADAMLLDPTLPEKQRARRRLVGAIALVVAAVVILPMVLDSHPKPVTDDIAIDIPTRPSTAPSRASDGKDDDTQAGVAPDTGDAGSGTAAAGIASAPAQAAAQPAVKNAKGAAAPLSSKQTESKPVAAKQAQSAASSTQTAHAGPHSSSNSNSGKTAVIPAPSSADADSGTPAAPPGARFAVRLGVFADDASARAWETKLKAAGVPAYTEHHKQADGKTRTFLLAGPFADRAAASAAVAKVRDAGLTASAGNAGQ